MVKYLMCLVAKDEQGNETTLGEAYEQIKRTTREFVRWEKTRAYLPVETELPLSEESGDEPIGMSKKRGFDDLGGSPGSKSDEEWKRHCEKTNASIKGMEPELPVNMHQAYSQIASCFDFSTTAANLEAYQKSGKEECLCLAEVLFKGAEKAHVLENAEKMCAWCKKLDMDWCVQVTLNVGTVRFRIAEGAEEQSNNSEKYLHYVRCRCL